jgi:hypothetical protein
MEVRPRLSENKPPVPHGSTLALREYERPHVIALRFLLEKDRGVERRLQYRCGS